MFGQLCCWACGNPRAPSQIFESAKYAGGFDNYPDGYRSRKTEKQLSKIPLQGLSDNQVANLAPQVERVASTKIQGRHLTQVREISKINVAPLKKGQT